ncbi:MAG: MFS transporter [Bacteriovoracaceae bacterium]|nr:MFS transporter [Bacteriovoracaceae bacterium]
MYRYLLVLSLGSVISFQAWRTLFNNFAVEVASIDSFGVGLIHSLREVPGFLALLVVYLLYLIKEHRLASISVIVTGLGVASVGLFPDLGGLIITTVIMSFGFHYFETVNQSLTLQYFSKKETPFVLARLKRFSALASILTGGVLFVSATSLPYKVNYILFGSVAVIAGIWSLRTNPTNPDLPAQHKKLILRREYWLYYLLTFLSGSRRQIFMVFATFLMVQKFNFSITTVTLLFAFNNLINFFWLPQIAKGINRFGERKMLMIEYTGMIAIFMVYAFTDSPIVVAIFYILDNMLFNFSMSIKTYFQKVADPKDIAPSAGVSFTINHIAAVVIPVLGGLLWKIDYKIPFFFGAFIGMFSLYFSMKVPIFAEQKND